MTTTPGPYWMAADSNPTDGSDREVWDVGVGDECLATFDRWEDALLYRAAPDMLAALTHIVNCTEISASDIDVALAAIAKAEGRE